MGTIAIAGLIGAAIGLVGGGIAGGIQQSQANQAADSAAKAEAELQNLQADTIQSRIREKKEILSEQNQLADDQIAEMRYQGDRAAGAANAKMGASGILMKEGTSAGALEKEVRRETAYNVSVAQQQKYIANLQTDSQLNSMRDERDLLSGQAGATLDYLGSDEHLRRNRLSTFASVLSGGLGGASAGANAGANIGAGI